MRFIVDVPSIETTVIRHTVEAATEEEAVELALLGQSDSHERVEEILELDEDGITVQASNPFAGPLNLLSYFWGGLKRFRRIYC